MLIEGRLSGEEGKVFATNLLRTGTAHAGGVNSSVNLPVLPSGRVQEIVWLDGKVSLDPRLSVRPLGWFERTWRMAWRVFRLWRHLDGAWRRRCGLTWGRAFSDLTGAYRIATRFRGATYQQWVDEVDHLTKKDCEAMRSYVCAWQDGPRFRIVLIGIGQDACCTEQTQASLDRQIYRNFSVAERNHPVGNDWVLLLRPGDRLPEYALYWFACEARAHPDAAMIYSDDDEIDGELRCRPRFKPDWSWLHLQETNFIGRAVAVNGHALASAGGLKPENFAGDTWELLLRVGQRAGDRVRHIPAVLLHRDAEVEKRMPPVIRRVRFDLPVVPPLVSIVIPTRDAVDLLRQCVESVLIKTHYPRFEIVVVDNGSREPDALAYLADIAARPNVRVLRYNQPFNYSAINNFAAREAQGDVLCLLNNDTEVITPDWLDEMVGHLVQDRVGVVGAKLLYPDGRVQHGGVTVGLRGAAHLHLLIERCDPGYCNRAIVAQELSAVTAACMVTWSDLYLRLKGLNEWLLPIAFNDIDYCLRARKAEYKVIWTPHAELYHHESVSRGKDTGWRRQFRAWREEFYMRYRWRREMMNDPFYNPNFSHIRPDFTLAPASSVKKPWEDL